MRMESIRPVSTEHVGQLVERYGDKMLSSYFYLSSLHGYSRSELESMMEDPPFPQFIIAEDGGEVLLSIHDVDVAESHARIQPCVRASGVDIGPVLHDRMRALGIDRLYAYLFREECAEQDLLLGAGFQLEAVFRQHVFMRGAYCDVLVYGFTGEVR